MNNFRVGGQSPITFDRFIRGIIALVIIGGIFAMIYALSGVLIPFFVAWVAAYLLYPLVRQLHKRLHNRFLAIFLTISLTIAALGTFVYIVIPPMLSEITHLKDVALSYIQAGGNADGIPQPVQKFLNEHVNEYKIEQFLQHEDVVTAIKNTVPRVWELLWSTAGIIINFAASLIGLLYLLFLLTDYEKYANSWITFIPPSKRPFATRFVADVERCMAGYFRGQALIALSNCVMFSIGFALVDFPLPIALGCLIGVISFVPYLQLVGVVPAALLALLKAAETGQNFWGLLCLIALVYIVVQILQDTIFTPRIMGHIMGLPPAIILLSLSVWGYAFGIMGLILALPVTTLAIEYYKRYVVGETDVPADGIDEQTVAMAKNAGVYIEEPYSANPLNKLRTVLGNNDATQTDEAENAPDEQQPVENAGEQPKPTEKQ